MPGLCPGGEGGGEMLKLRFDWYIIEIKLSSPGTRFSKLPIITGPVKVFCFPFQMRVSEGLKTVQ